MSHVELSEQAQEDLERLYLFLAEKNESAAYSALATIRTEINAMAYFPESFREIDSVHNLHELVIEFGASGYVALYHYDKQADFVLVLAIKHQLEDTYRL